MRTRLWLASPHFYPTYGGAQNRYRSYIPGLLQRNLDVRVMTGTPQIQERSEADNETGWYEAKPGAWLEQTILDGAPLERIRLPDGKTRSRTQIYYDAVLEVCGRPHQGPVVAQLLTNLRPQALPWLRRLKQSGVAVLYSISQFPTWQQKPIKRLLRHRGYQQVYNEFDALVTNSEAIEEFLRELGVTTRVEYIPNGVNLSRFHPVDSEQEQLSAQALRQSLSIPADHQVIVAVGAVMPRKAPEEIVKAWRLLLSRFPNTHLLFVGPKSHLHDPRLAKFGSNINELIETSGAADKVHFVGIVDDVESYLRASDIFVLASKREGTPNSVLEGMACGLPALVAPYQGISAGIGQAGEQYQLVERNPDAIAAALTTFLEQPELRATQGECGRRFVIENVDQQVTLDRYAALYQELGAMALERAKVAGSAR
ncbi:MAG: glycosyltransferase family 4 protein [Desulfobacterales bacterium]|jgi:glycosyltransferase involved in cell wall biosynthesis|nr:glycosyltransferase family 4 protein [Desulfobacterales bacterium]